ncbi:MAG: hypothetical protein JSU86_01840, partial [Phycisphaerales bacterium]
MNGHRASAGVLAWLAGRGLDGTSATPSVAVTPVGPAERSPQATERSPPDPSGDSISGPVDPGGASVAGFESVRVPREGPPIPAGAAAEPELLAFPSDPITRKVRYLSFTAGDPGRIQAVRMIFLDIPAPYDSWNGVAMWVQEPTTYCENAGKDRPPCVPAVPRDEWLGATLGCDPWFGDFNSPGMIHVFHEGIIPDGTFVIQVVDQGCPLNMPGMHSDPLTMTMSRWGDLINNCVSCPCGPADGVVGIPTDVTAVLDKFKNLAPPSMPCYAVVKV